MTPATDWKEEIAPDETARFEAMAEQLRGLQRARAQKGSVNRGLHAKGQIGIEAEVTILPDLPEEARIALFATPSTHRAYVRFSNGAGGHQSDRKGDVRGIAIKLLGVPGKKIIPGLENAQTQDFLLIRNSSQPFASPDRFVEFVTAIESPLTGLPKYLWKNGPRWTFGLLKQIAAGLNEPMVSLATTRYYSALPTMFGPYAVRWALTPHAKADAKQQPGKGRDYLGDELAARLRAGPITYDLEVQFFRDAARTPIEDASVDWKESDAPYVTVARLTLLQQDPASPRGQKLKSFVEGLSFDPWHALAELRPLGAMMRARNSAYRLSTQERKAAVEPDGTEKFD
jgi:hypothetical protein